VWFHFVGVHCAGLTLWHEKQLTVVGMWLAVLPVAVLPLWQVEHTVSAVKVLWSVRAPAQVVDDLWQI
jgi:hypothetical protein